MEHLSFSQRINNNSERAKSVPAVSTNMTTSNSRLSRSSQFTLEQQGEKRELDLLNNRFGNYLNKIKQLATINTQLHRQVDEAYKKYIGHTENSHLNNQLQHPFEMKLNQLRQQLNDEIRAQTLIQIRQQRANYDIQCYRTNMKFYSSYDQKQSEHIRIIKQQLETNLYEFEQLKEQYEKREKDLHIYKTQYNEYMNKLVEYSNEYDKIIYERMVNENDLHSLKERFLFEQEYCQRRQQEFQYIEKFHFDFQKEFTQNEFQNIIEKIRKDYQEFNAISLVELEKSYQMKFENIQKEFLQQNHLSKPKQIRQELNSTKQEQRTLIEQNLILKDKLEQLEQDLQHIIEQNHQKYEISNREYKQLQIEIPELDYIIVHLRENTVNLWSEINTYRYLLVNLLSKSDQRIPNTTTEQPFPSSKSIINKTTTTTVGTRATTSRQQYRDETTGFIVHIEDGIIWVRI